MKRIEKLYEEMAGMANRDLYLIEPEFCQELYYHIPTEFCSTELNSVELSSVEPRPMCIRAFLLIVNWFEIGRASCRERV